MTQPLLAIIADDLTGALDAAAPFAASRGGVVVATHPAALDAALARTPDIVSISTRSREIAPEVARDIVAGVLAALPPGTPVLKKIDSRMKGNIAAELEAFGEGPKLVIPAIPDLGRVVRDGALVGFGADEPIPIRPALGRFADNAIVPDIADAADIAWAVAAAPSGTVFVGARG
ncbi:MAG: four-carbon acid sugar kinase family protein, partial [Rhodobiaceae bacterium]|nr:four-carbon acid sugar kinase family protein [Rhodobiaceae bacterium]